VTDRPTLTELADDLRNSAKVLHEFPLPQSRRARVADNITNTAAILDDLATAKEPTVEIGGQVMTQAQYDAARFPLLNPTATPHVDDDGWQMLPVKVHPADEHGVHLVEFGDGNGPYWQTDVVEARGLKAPVPPPRTHTVTLDGHTLTIPAADVCHLVAEYGGEG
jgi:hypothetical protein